MRAFWEGEIAFTKHLSIIKSPSILWESDAKVISEHPHDGVGWWWKSMDGNEARKRLDFLGQNSNGHLLNATDGLSVRVCLRFETPGDWELKMWISAVILIMNHIRSVPPSDKACATQLCPQDTVPKVHLICLQQDRQHCSDPGETRGLHV